MVDRACRSSFSAVGSRSLSRALPWKAPGVPAVPRARGSCGLLEGPPLLLDAADRGARGGCRPHERAGDERADEQEPREDVETRLEAVVERGQARRRDGVPTRIA